MKRHAAAKTRRQAVIDLAKGRVQSALFQSMAMMPVEARSATKHAGKPARKPRRDDAAIAAETTAIEVLLRRGGDVRAIAAAFDVRVGTVRSILARIASSMPDQRQSLHQSAKAAMNAPTNEPSRRLGGAFA